MTARLIATGMRLALAFAAALAAGCHFAAAPDAGGAVSQAQRDAALRDADWSRQVNLDVAIRDYGYLPRELRLRAGSPYRITLTNNGSVPHYFTAPEFLATVAARKAEVRHHAEIKASVFSGFELAPRGGSLDLYLVPLRAGTFRAYCHMKDHAAMGVEGVVVVE